MQHSCKVTVQIDLYRRALQEATATPVRSATLYALALGEGATRS